MGQCLSFLLEFAGIHKSLFNGSKIIEIVFDDANEVTKTVLLALQVLYTTSTQNKPTPSVTASINNFLRLMFVGARCKWQVWHKFAKQFTIYCLYLFVFICDHSI